MPRSRRTRLRFATRPLWLALLLALAWIVSEPRVLPPVGPIGTDREKVATRFTRCGTAPGFACVVDGDTFRLGDRRIRIADINAPELRDPQCPAEARLAERSTRALLDALNDGEFTMVANRFDRTDRYGRELRSLFRAGANGEQESIGEALVEQGHAKGYWGTLSRDWC